MEKLDKKNDWMMFANNDFGKKKKTPKMIIENYSTEPQTLKGFYKFKMILLCLETSVMATVSSYSYSYIQYIRPKPKPYVTSFIGLWTAVLKPGIWLTPTILNLWSQKKPYLDEKVRLEKSEGRM